MRRLTILCVLLIAPAARADVSIDPPVLDLGELRSGKAAECVFRIHNRGTVAVELLDLERSCGCVAPTWSSRTVAPGKTETVVVKLRTLGQPEGARSWPVTLVTRVAGELQRMPLEIKATVRNEIVMQPPQVALIVTKSVEQVITLTDSRDKPLRVRSWKCDLPGVTIEKLEEIGGVTRLKMVVDGSKVPPGRHDQVIRLETSDVLYDSLEIPVTLVRRETPRVVWSPETPEVVLAAGQGKGSVLIRVRGLAQPIDRAVGNGIKCAWAADGDSVLLRATLDRGHIAAGAVQSAVHIQAGTERVTIPIIVRAE